MKFEQQPEYFERSFLSDETRQEMLFKKMQDISQDPAESMAIESALFASVVDSYESNPRIRSLLDEFRAVRTDMTITHLSYMIRSVFQKQAISSYGMNYPNNFATQSKWDDVIATVAQSETVFTEVRQDLLERHLQTNIPDRYKAVVIAADWMRQHGRFPDGVTIFDFGCSRNLGLKSIAAIEMNRDMDGKIFHNFNATQYVEPADTRDITLAKDIVIDNELSEATTIAHGQPTGIRVGIGFDIEDISLLGNKEWAQANLTPNEHANGLATTLDMFERSFNTNYALSKVRIGFRQEDILLGNHLDYIDSDQTQELKNESGFADITLLITVLNQMSEVQRSKAIMRAIRYTKPTGIVLIQDFARVNPDVPAELDFLDRNWNTNFSYRTIMLDRMNPYGFQEIMRWNGGRTQQLNIPQDRRGAEPLLVPEHGFSAMSLYEHIRQYKNT